MKSNLVERIILGAGAIVLLGYGATLLIPSFHSYGDLFRLLAIAAIACYALYSFWTQNMDQKDLYSMEQDLKKVKTELQAANQRASHAESKARSANASLEQVTSELNDCKSRIETLEKTEPSV
ncbi:MAG: hypothetical protein ACKVKW_06160 [Flavobacteriales bacterium]|jgi:peptidoglycan hydrolase CwlO-like protein|nr:hypothetical protein [Schleiferiaceae bacterium]|tara:strand:+ start:6369 stop:6737 length:369 start_codon:yes stop_codon:yes gene_type:complete